MIAFREITHQNLRDVVRLRVRADQQSYVASNMESLAEAYATRNEGHIALPFAVYDDEQLIGFVMLGYGDMGNDAASDTEKNNYCLWRLMIGEQHQGKGYFKAILDAVVQYVKTFPCGEAKHIWLSYEPSNQHAQQLYQKYGFVENGELCDGEIVAVYPLEK